MTVSHPVTRESVGHTQQISKLQQSCTPTPDSVTEETDGCGNACAEAAWSNVAGSITAMITAQCLEETLYGPVLTNSPYPVDPSTLPDDAGKWLIVDDWQTQADAPEIRHLATELAEGAWLAIEVVGRILGWSPLDWHASIGAPEVKAGPCGPMPTRSVFLTIIPPPGAPVGAKAALMLIARDGDTVVGSLKVDVEVGQI